MVGTEARRVETEEANDELLETFRLGEILERSLSRRRISTRFWGEREGLGMSVQQHGKIEIGLAGLVHKPQI